MKRMNGKTALLVLAVMACFPASRAGTEPNAPRSGVEVVFVLDSTGSMGALIEGAKRKVWSIANTIVASKIAQEGRIGLISYRDRGDQYITRRYDMDDDLDSVSRHLQSFAADGGGDGPESVNQALAEAVHLMSWTPGPEVLRIIFLVGDAPPHMDYRDDVPYPQTCREAVQAGLIINTVQCGTNLETRRFWEEIARLAEGAYVALQQSGNMTATTSPYDKEILRLATELNRTVVVYGSNADQELSRGKLAAAEGWPLTAPRSTWPAAARSSRGAATWWLTGRTGWSTWRPWMRPACLRGCVR
jgi:Mg-chelatase subunit ChlD